MPTPIQDESREHFLDRCIPQLIQEGKSRDQAIAQCISLYEQRKEQKCKLEL